MSVVSRTIQPDIPITEETVRDVASTIDGGKLFSNPRGVIDYAFILGPFHYSAQTILAMPDYILSEPTPSNPPGCPTWMQLSSNIVGKAATESMCHSVSSFSSCVGPVNNPYAPCHTTGGSSSGCGALVADGSVNMAIGADQGGSIRVPSAFYGLVGLRPHTIYCYRVQRVAARLCWPICATVADVALLQAIVGADGLDDRSGAGCPFPPSSSSSSSSSLPRLTFIPATPTPTVPPYTEPLSVPGADSDLPLKGKKIGILTEILTETLLMPFLNSSVAEKVREVSGLFAELGAVVGEVSVPLHKEALGLWMAANRCIGGRTRLGQQGGYGQICQNDLQLLFPLKQKVWEKFIPEINALYAWKNMPSLYGKAMNMIMEIAHTYDVVLESYDCLILPTVTFVANAHPAPRGTALQKVTKSVGQGLNCYPFNVTEHLALSLTIETLPVGMQIVGKWWGEEWLFQLVTTWDGKWDWRVR